MRSPELSTVSGLLLLLVESSSALNIDFNKPQSIKDAAQTIVIHMLSIYNSNNSTGIPGLFPAPYYWWESGLAMDSLVNYWSLTGDSTYNDIVSDGLLWQIGPDKNYMPPNQTKSLGNDDQSTWALACMTAAERGFPNPPASSGVKSWLQLAQNVFDSQVQRWDTGSCGVGLRWKIYTFNNGYDYKNALSNGNFMQLSARLARYTGNQTYSEWASKAYQWSLDVGLVDAKTLAVYDGTAVSQNCKKPNKIQWTSNLGTYLSANAYMSNLTSKPDWSYNTSALFKHAEQTFFTPANSANKGILTEVTCVSQNTCNTDDLAFRAILVRALYVANNGQYPGSISSLLKSNAAGAAAQCSGGTDGSICGSNWSSSKWDGTQGLGQDLSALEIILATLPLKTDQTEQGTTTNGSFAATTSTGGAGAAKTNDAGSTRMSLVGIVAMFVFALLLW